MNFTFFLPPLFSFLLTLLGLFLILKFFPRFRLIDRPHEYGLTRKPVPYSGGIIFVLVFFLAILFFIEITPQIIGVMASVLLLTIVNFIDDRKRLPPLPRLATQIFVGGIVVFSGIQIQLINTPFGAPLMLDRFTFTVFNQQIWLLSGLAIIAWLVLMMNVTNWLDGIPGLASGISTITFATILLLALQKFNMVDQTTVIILAGVLGASTLAFCFFDFAPPRLLMGDTGSMFLGFMIGILAIIAGGKFATAILILGFPVADAFFVVFRRLLAGKSPMKGDLSHFHHRLLRAGFSEKSALLFHYGLCLVFAAIALFLHSTFEKSMAFLAVVALLLVFAIIETHGSHFRNQKSPGD